MPMPMPMERSVVFFFLQAVLWLVLSTRVCNSIESDIQCLKGIKETLKDPYNYLSSWNFNNKTRGFICDFKGIECWHPDQNKVINVHLSNMSLQGQFPFSLKNCTTLTGLDLSNNSLFGSLPLDVSEVVPFLTSLNLSYNKISGRIPPSLGNCSYLNVLDLQHNDLTGQIPKQLGNLSRLALVDVANNRLSGQIPSFMREIEFSRFANNSWLCGKPLGVCRAPSRRPYTWIIAISLVVAFVSIIGISFLCFHRVTAITAFAQRFVVGLFFMENKNKKAALVSIRVLNVSLFNDRGDRWKWIFGVDGQFSVKSFYLFLHGDGIRCIKPESFVWDVHCPP